MLRIIDANLNRAGEGLRVLEDIARFILGDAELTGQLKSIRHALFQDIYPLQQEILMTRKAAEDVGASIEADGERVRQDLRAVVRANAKRVQESVRVLEEFAKLPSVPSDLNSPRLQQIRFDVYELEQQLVCRLLRKEKASRLSGLYVIIDPQMLKGRSPEEVTREAVGGGASVIQLRDKVDNGQRTIELARDLKGICDVEGALFIINDRLDIALAVAADGLHVGQEDLPVSEVRRVLSLNALVGCSTSTLAEACQAVSSGADYVAVGSIYPTKSKERFILAGLERLREIKREVSVPVVAIGGINEANVEGVIEAGADSVAVISAVSEAEDVEKSARCLVEKIVNSRGDATRGG